MGPFAQQLRKDTLFATRCYLNYGFFTDGGHSRAQLILP